MSSLALVMAWVTVPSSSALARADCDRACLESIATQYRQAYVAHDPARLPLAKGVRFTENNVAMPVPDGTWDTVAREIGPALTTVEPETGAIGILTSIQQNDVQGFLSIRLQVREHRITQIEHIVATQRNLSLSKLGDVEGFVHDPMFAQTVPSGERTSRAGMLALVGGYFETLERNDGALKGVRFAPDARRLSNGVVFADLGKTMANGFFRFNDRARDRSTYLVDEERGLALASFVLDHKGRLNRYKLADGADMQSPYREPHSLYGVELFKIRAGVITGMETIYVQVPYNMPWAWRRPAR